jgi:phage/plasmid-like protein (TIGR03299 family)
MSMETAEWLNENTLIGFTAKRGNAWHYRADLQGGESNHYPGAIPVADVERRLFHWKPVESPLYVESPVSGGLEVVPNRKAILRSDNGHPMGIFADGYEGHDYNKWLVENVESLLDTDLAIGSAVLLKGGAVASVSVEVPDTITTPEGVEFRPNLLAVTSFDGTIATTYKRTVTNVVCDNTMRAALSEKGQQFKVKHTKSSKLKLAEARDAVSIVYSIADDFQAEVKRLCEITVSDKEWAKFLDAHAPLPEKVVGRPLTRGEKMSLTRVENTRDTFAKLWNHDNRVTPWKGTAWGVVQAVNTFEHHEGSIKGGNRPERNLLLAAKGKWDDLDHDTLATLGKTLDVALAA